MSNVEHWDTTSAFGLFEERNSLCYRAKARAVVAQLVAAAEMN